MSTRSKINVFGKDYEVRWVDPKPNIDSIGTFSYPLLRITLERGQPIAMAESTMLHELLEAINRELRLRLPHDAIDRLEAGLYSVLRGAGVSLRPLVEVKG